MLVRERVVLLPLVPFKVPLLPSLPPSLPCPSPDPRVFIPVVFRAPSLAPELAGMSAPVMRTAIAAAVRTASGHQRRTAAVQAARAEPREADADRRS